MREVELEIVDEPMSENFCPTYPTKVIKVSDYNLGFKKEVVPVVERTTETITLPKHSAHDMEIITVTIGGESHRVPRWMVRYLSGQC